MVLPNSIYDVLKWIGRIFLPALAVFYGTIGKIWNLPYTEQIPLTITALAVFINAICGISAYNYNNGNE